MPNDWLAGQGVEVNVQSLMDYSDDLAKEVQNFQASQASGVRALMMQQVPFGAGGLQEGIYMRVVHANRVRDIAAFLADAARGTMALSIGARTIATGYAEADGFAKADLDDVRD